MTIYRSITACARIWRSCPESFDAVILDIFMAGLTGGALCITVDNTCTGRLRYAPSGALLSTKHRGLGMGTQSVRSIAEKYGGVCRFEAGDGMFYASVLCGGV